MFFLNNKLTLFNYSWFPKKRLLILCRGIVKIYRVYTERTFFMNPTVVKLCTLTLKPVMLSSYKQTPDVLVICASNAHFIIPYLSPV